MYVFITKTESGGMFWRTLYNRLLFGLVLSNVFIGVVVKARGTWTMVGALAPLPLLILGLKIYTSKTFDEDIHYYSRSGMGDPERLATKGRPKSIAMVATKFGHPALYKPLMTPMVHAKARDVLAQIYRGRLHSDSGSKEHSVLRHCSGAHEPRRQTRARCTFRISPRSTTRFCLLQEPLRLPRRRRRYVRPSRRSDQRTK